MRRFLIGAILCLMVVAGVRAAGKTICEHSPPLPRPTDGTLGTTPYAPLPGERAFYQRLAPDERTNGSIFEDYDIVGKTGKFVGWFGVVRDIKPGMLVVEHKYQDGMTDIHQLVCGWHGAGTFHALVDGAVPLKPLELVRVYGTVTGQSGPVPVVHAEYIRDWDWGQFSFMEYGKQKGDGHWVQQSRLQGQEVYSPAPTAAYYQALLGHR